MSDLYTWCDDYIGALPPAIRPRTDDARLVAAARRARDNGWASSHAARIVAGHNYATAQNPVYIALLQLERIAERAPQQRIAPANSSGCIVCPPGPPCPDPVGPEHILPKQWAQERFDLIRELMRTPDYSEDEREQAMAILIADQKGRAA